MDKYISRIITPAIKEADKYYRVITITGPRQSGKTSLCRHIYPDYKYINLEHIAIRTNAIADPAGFIDSLGDHVIIDEVQHVPQLLSMIQVRVDENRNRKYILTGNSNFSLLRTVTQSLAGRAALFTLLPFSFKELNKATLSQSINRLMWQGEYPGVIVDNVPPSIFYRNYYTTYVERDLRDLLNIKNLLAFDNFVRLLASRVGLEFNASSLAREIGVTSKTISEWLSILTTSYIAFPLQPYFNNISKRLSKMPKVYFYDTGLLCYLLSITSAEQLDNHPLRGAIFENSAIVELLKSQYNQSHDPNLYFYREHSGREIDALMVTPDGLDLYEIKAGKVFNPDFRKNMEYLKREISEINNTTVIYDGESYPPVSVNIRDI